MYTEGVTVCTPTIPPRQRLLTRALESVAAQTRPVSAVVLAFDTDHGGAWATRNRALGMVRTEWTLFLDDDDELLPHCVASLLRHADEQSADVVWGWFEVRGGTDPFPAHRHLQFDPARPHVIPITYLARTELLHDALVDVGGFGADTVGDWSRQDLPILAAMHSAGARFFATGETVWRWHHHRGNTSGLPTRW